MHKSRVENVYTLNLDTPYRAVAKGHMYYLHIPDGPRSQLLRALLLSVNNFY